MPDNNAVQSKPVLIIFIALLLWGILPLQGNAQLSYWVAPAATGTGDGSSSANAAGYSNPTFWSGTVKPQLSSTGVTVNFLSGTYNSGSLSFTNMGNPLYPLTLAAVTPQGSVFSLSSSYSYLVYLSGCQNIQLNGFIFTNNVAYWGVYCIPNGTLPCRNITINNCWFLNLTNAYYAAIGLLNGTRSIQVLNCNFTNIMDNNGNHQHIIYAPHEIEDVVVSNCIAQDCLADYMRFRDDGEYCVVENSTFISTMNSTAWPFVSAELYNETNSDSAGDEFFGTYFQVSSNTFIYKTTGGSGPHSGLHFSDTGWSPYSFDCNLTSSQVNQFTNGSVSFQQSFMQTNFGITASDIKMFGNTYSGVTYYMDYQYNSDGVAPSYWTGVMRLDNTPDTSGTAMDPPPVLRNGDFDRQGLLLSPRTPGDLDYQCLFRNWQCSPKYTDITNTLGFYGTSNALRFDAANSQTAYQWLTPPGPNWTMDFLFAMGSSFTGTGTKFKVDLFHNDISGAKVSVGVDNLGRFGIYNGGTFTVLPELGTVTFSTDANGNGNYTDSGDTLNVYHMRIVGNYSAATPYVDLYTSDANSLLLTHQSLGHTTWVSGAPVSGQSSPETVALYNFTAPAMVDQIAFTKGIPPTISTIRTVGKLFIFSGTNGSAGETFYVLSTTNLALPLADWTRESTNTFSGSSFSVSHTTSASGPPKFYSLQLQ
jgi:hypothetical protein